MKKILILLLISSISITALSQHHSFSLSPHDFLLDGKPFQIISGEMHPARIPREYWRQRIQMAKAMGCNTIAVYIFWNYHEIKEGSFDFKTGNRDIASFIRICHEEGMWVLLRPGPYVCAEWDFGGLPSYLLKYHDIKIRCMDKRYMDAVQRYILHLSKEIVPLQCTNGGPVLMVQIENEYGSYGNDMIYLETLKNSWLKQGINVPFYTADGASPNMLEAGHLKGTAVGLDSGGSDDDFAEAKKADSLMPSFSSETYPGWLTHWGEKWQRPDTNDLKKELVYLLQNKRSFNLYVVHGGTNFGFTAGANSFSTTQYQPAITSYDYDAPINEQGQPTAKYFMIRGLISKYTGHALMSIPKTFNTIEIPPVNMSYFSNIWNNLPAPLLAIQPRPMEDYGQNQGMILYRTTLTGQHSGKLAIWDPHDYALVFLDGQFIDTIFRDGGKWTINIPKTANKNPVLDILVEGMGHVNFSQFMIDRKGITDRVSLNGITLMNWDVFLLPMDPRFVSHMTGHGNNEYPKRCAFFKGNFSLEQTGDTFFDMGNYNKGSVYINGHNLGRYWSVGPQKRLYCPAGWLHKGYNEIIVYDFFELTGKPVQGFTTME